MNILEPTRKPKVIYTANSLEFGKSSEELSWNHCTSTPHRSETHGTAERAVRRVKKGHLRYCCSPVLVTNGGRIPWSVTAICETFRIFCLMGRHHMKGGSECLLTDQWYRLEQWSNVTLLLRRTYRVYINLAQKSCQAYFSVMHYTRGESGKETSWSQTLKNWRRWTHSNSTPEGSMQKKCWRQWKVTIFIFLSQMRQSNPWRKSASETIHINQGSSWTRRGTRSFSRSAKMRKLKMVSGLLREISFIAITWNPESNFTCRKKNHFLLHWSTPTLPEQHILHLMYCWRNLLQIAGKLSRQRIIRCMDRLHSVQFIERKGTWRINMFRVETDEETNNLKTRQEWAVEKPKLDNSRRLRLLHWSRWWRI